MLCDGASVISIRLLQIQCIFSGSVCCTAVTVYQFVLKCRSLLKQKIIIRLSAALPYGNPKTGMSANGKIHDFSARIHHFPLYRKLPFFQAVGDIQFKIKRKITSGLLI